MQHGSLQLKAWQKRGNMNQREAAQKLQVHFTTYNQFLTGRRVPGRDLAVFIQEQTGIPVGAWTPTRVGKSKNRAPQQARPVQYLQGENHHAR